MFENKKINRQQFKNNSKQSLVDYVKNLPLAKKIAIPVAFVSVMLLGAKLLDSTGTPSQKQTPIVTKTPAPTPLTTAVPATIVVSSTAPSLANNGTIGAPPLPVPTGSITLKADLPEQKPDPNLTLKKEATAELDDLKQQLAITNAKLDAISQQVASNSAPAQQQVVAKKIYPHYTNKPIKRQSSGYAEVGNRRWDADSSYLVK